MAIWKSPATVEQLNARIAGTLDAHLGIRIEAVGDDWLRASMPVDERTRQPRGLLHGGASCVLAESLGSLGTVMTLDPERHICVGQDINANHLRAVARGRVTATARPFHIGTRSQVWHIEIRNEAGQLSCVARLTTAVLARSAVTPRPEGNGDSRA